MPGCVFRSGGEPVAPAVADLPLIVYPPGLDINASDNATDTLVVMLSGDGGWAGLDKAVGQSLAQAGYAVVGWDSLRYYWRAREPAEAAADLDRIVQTYRQRWQLSHVALVGYSRGADVLPFLYNRLPADTRARVSAVLLLGLASHITFEYHLLSMIGRGPQGRAVLPEAQRLPADRTTCLYGVDDPDAVCEQLQAAGLDVVALPGGHHFDHRYQALADLLQQTIAARE
ncbi:virulence factor family protein [Salinisphaera sp. T31B1]